MWQIPISDQVTSVGVVSNREHHVKSGESVDKFFNWIISLNPVLAERMRGAERVREFRMDGNYSYCLDHFAGDGWLAVGDAAFFIDPIFSSGVSDALHSAKFAAQAIARASLGADYSVKSFSDYQKTISRAAGVWHYFVNLFYEVGPIFSRVIAEGAARVPIMRLCEGYVYDESASQTLAYLKEIFDGIRAESDHPLGKLLTASAQW